MKETAGKYEEVIQKAFRVVKKYLSNHEDCKDLAQIVALKYHLNIDKIDHSTLDNWVYTTARNAAVDFLRKRKNDPQEKAANFELIENQLTSSFLDHDQDLNAQELIENYSVGLSRPEREILRIYAENGFRIKKIAKRKKLGYEAIKKKIYRLKSELRANYNREMGMIASRQIVGAKLHENLINFLKKFRKAMENNDLDSMSIYLRDCEIPPRIPAIKILKVIGYDLELIDDNTYQLFVSYDSGERENRIFRTTFQVYNENAIKIVDFPSPPSSIVELDTDKMPPELKKLAVRDRTGKLKLNDVDLDILKKYRKK